MQKYHYSDGVNSFGPFTLDELHVKGINPDTFVWTEGMTDWVKAKTIPELSFLLNKESGSFAGGNPQVPPVFSQTATPTFGQNFQQPPKTYLVETILTTIFCCWILGIPSIIYAARVEKKFYAGDIRGAEEDSANAKKWMWINVGASVGLWVLYFLIFGVAFFASVMS